MEIDTAVSGPAAGNTGDAKASDPLDDALSKALAASGLEDDSFAQEAPLRLPETTPVSENAAPVSGESAPSASEPTDKAPRKRDDNGRFAPNEDAPEPVAAPEALLAPDHWDRKWREAFGTLPPEARKLVVDVTKGVEANATRKSQELSTKAQFADAVLSAIDDSDRQQLARAGLTEAQGLDRLLQLNRMATQDPPGYARWFFESAGLRPEQVFPGFTGAPQAQPQGSAPASPVDPQIPQLYDTVRGLQSKLDGYERQREEAEMRQANQTLASFASQTDSSGTLLHPHYERVRQRMALLYSGEPEIASITDERDRLAAAYDAAVFADPILRAQSIDAEVQKKEAARLKQSEVDKARRAQAPVRSAPAVSPTTPRSRSIEDAVTRAMESHGL